MEPTLNRRSAATLGLTGLALASCGMTPSAPPTEIPTLKVKPAEAGVVVPEAEAKQKLFAIIEGLPDSPIKTSLIERVLPYYQQPGLVRNFYGVEIKVHTATIGIEYKNTILAEGGLEIRGEGDAPPEKLYPATDTAVSFPVTHVVQEQDRQRFGRYFTRDGILVAPYLYRQTDGLYEGISPRITLTTIDRSKIRPDQVKFSEDMEQFILLKEACTLLLIDTYIEHTVRKMKELGLPTQIPVRKPNGTIVQAEIVSQVISEQHVVQGKLVAALDIAGSLVAFKAVEQTPLLETAAKGTSLAGINMNGIYPEVKDVALGNTPDDILTASLSWAITNPNARRLPHTGTLNDLFPNVR